MAVYIVVEVDYGTEEYYGIRGVWATEGEAYLQVEELEQQDQEMFEMYNEGRSKFIVEVEELVG